MNLFKIGCLCTVHSRRDSIRSAPPSMTMNFAKVWLANCGTLFCLECVDVPCLMTSKLDTVKVPFDFNILKDWGQDDSWYFWHRCTKRLRKGWLLTVNSGSNLIKNNMAQNNGEARKERTIASLKGASCKRICRSLSWGAQLKCVLLFLHYFSANYLHLLWLSHAIRGLQRSP